MEQDYSKREMDVTIKRIDEKLDAIHEQTTKTNGRVTNSEEEINSLKTDLKEKFAFIRGGLAVITVLILPILLFIVYQYIQHK